MLTYDLTHNGDTPLYEYLYRCIKEDITGENLIAGQKLPSKRTFAKNLGVSVITVENAYEQLIAEGYIYSVPKSGYFVMELNKTFEQPEEVKEQTKENEIIPAEIEEEQYIADFASNQTPHDLFPFGSWAKVIREVLNDSRIQLMTNSPWGGVLALRESIAKYLKEFRGMNVVPEQIIIGAGTEYLYGQLIKLLGTDKSYAVENPGYGKISKIYNSYKVACSYIDMDKDGIIVDELEKKKVDIMHISPSHHFPTGIVMPISRRYELLGWAAKSDKRYIIEDDYDSELRLSGQPIPTLQSIDVSDKVIYMNTFTKTLASTVRIGYMVLPKPLLKRYIDKLSFYSCTVSNFEQYTLARFMEEGGFEKHINRMRNHYHKKRDLILNSIEKSRLKKHVQISGQEAGVHFLMQIDTKLSDEDFVGAAKKRGVKLAPLSTYYYENQEMVQHTFVINYSSIPLDRIEEVVEIISAIVDNASSDVNG